MRAILRDFNASWYLNPVRTGYLKSMQNQQFLLTPGLILQHLRIRKYFLLS